MAHISLKQARAVLLLCGLLATQTSHVAAVPVTQQRVVVRTQKHDSQRRMDNNGASGKRPVVRDFDTLRNYDSYDPSTDTWSAIEEFDGVDIIEKDTIEKRLEHYVYYNFWAYDPVQKAWQKVDIRDYGYKQAAPARSEQTPVWNWANTVVGVRLGLGGTQHRCLLPNTGSFHRDSARYLYTDPSWESGHAMRTHWFGEADEHIENFHRVIGFTKKPYDASGKTLTYKGTALHIPFVLTLHHTFFDKIRVGGNAVLNTYYLKTIHSNDESTDSSYSVADQNRWFHHWAWSGLLGWKFFRRDTYDWVVELHMGRSYRIGSRLKTFLKEREHLGEGMYYKIGAQHEYRLANHVQWATGGFITCQVQRDDKAPVFLGEESSRWLFNQAGLQLETGLHFNIGSRAPKRTARK